jgi:hypothetical protein
LSYIGEIKSDITENRFEDHYEDSGGACEIRNGDFSLKIKLARDIDQYVPMHAKKMRIC